MKEIRYEDDYGERKVKIDSPNTRLFDRLLGDEKNGRTV